MGRVDYDPSYCCPPELNATFTQNSSTDHLPSSTLWIVSRARWDVTVDDLDVRRPGLDVPLLRALRRLSQCKRKSPGKTENYHNRETPNERVKWPVSDTRRRGLRTGGQDLEVPTEGEEGEQKPPGQKGRETDVKGFHEQTDRSETEDTTVRRTGKTTRAIDGRHRLP